MTPRKITTLRPTLAPIITPRWVYLLTYLVIAVFGFVAAVSGVPSIDLTTPAGYRPIWAGVVLLSAGMSFAACLLDAPRWERWAVLAVLAASSAYVSAAFSLAADGDTNRQSFAVVTIALMIVPVGRFVELLPRWSRK